MNNNAKSATLAGLLGIFLGAVGAHDWYLGDKKKGTIHVVMFGVGMALMLIAGAILPSTMSVWTLYRMGWLVTLLHSAGWLVVAASELWGFSDGIQILIKGDEGLKQRGFKVVSSEGVASGMNGGMYGGVNGGMDGGINNSMGSGASVGELRMNGGAANDGMINDGMGQGGNGGVVGQGDGRYNAGINSGNNGDFKVAKQTMDPEKKKKLIKFGMLGVGGILIVGAIGVAVLMLTKVEYRESYVVAKELKTKVADMNNNYDCERVINNVSSTYTTESTYADYVNECRNVTEGVDELVEKLGKTSGVKRNKDIKTQFEKFEGTIKTVLPDTEELAQRLDVYQIWHKFIVMADGLTAGKSSDAEIQNAAKVLIESGNQVLATYGTGWLEKTLAYVQAYRTYYNTSYSAENKTELRTIMEDAQKVQKNWMAENKPDIAEVGGLSFENTTKMYSEFSKLYSMISEAYEKNYDESGECLELFGEVMCD